MAKPMKPIAMPVPIIVSGDRVEAGNSPPPPGGWRSVGAYQGLEGPYVTRVRLWLKSPSQGVLSRLSATQLHARSADWGPGQTSS